MCLNSRADVGSWGMDECGECEAELCFNKRVVSAARGDWTGPATTLGSTFPVGAASAGTGANVAVLPMSVGMLSWPAGIAGGMPGSLG